MRVWLGKVSVMVAVLLGVAAGAQPAQARQPRDWIIGSSEEGDYLVLDLIFGALQGAYEHREEVYGSSNLLTLRASALAALPYGSTQADIDMRILNLTLGTSVGYQDFWRNQSYAPGEPYHRKERRERDAAGEFNNAHFPFWEGRIGMGFLFNDYVAFNHLTAWRIADMPDRTFDNVTNIVHDGKTVRQDFQLVLHHKDYGAFVPMFQLMHSELDNDWRMQWNWGFMLVSRAGLARRDDVISVQMLFHSGPVFDTGRDNRDVYGAGVLRGPMTLLVAYRSLIEL